ncbi:hypothetical protein OOK58_42570 [Streptomyces sp. NBC_01728]|uniref:hypothetical protein n=1 Tax=Streptomyces TaxID=1883 RepID=UPI002255A0A9|nr:MULTISPECIES: hypothetical protein [Streptomyces]MCX4458597.1 hypothetical protein [Streptomyces sp. NBC_01719]MCX4497954.1 hypothetical protein [Streptomyces sp. NBC_01728]MCX4609424.1 hypothetical protein [Streptomyces mirabilis]
MAVILTIPASEIREGDAIRGHYRPGVTVETAVRFGEGAPDRSDRALRPLLWATGVRAEKAGVDAVPVRSGRRLADADPVVVIRR